MDGQRAQERVSFTDEIVYTEHATVRRMQRRNAVVCIC